MRNVQTKLLRTLLVAAVMVLPRAVLADEFKPEPIGVIEQLPSPYPEHWALVHDFSFFHMFEGEVLVVDPLAGTAGEQYKGMITASFIAAFQRSKVRDEFYVIETFQSRGGRGGERTDTVTIWDPASLKVKGEIIIPPKRITGMPKNGLTGLLDNDRFLGVYNFTPAQSISIVDLEQRTFVAEIETPGCGFVIPHSGPSFSSLCSNGTFHTSHLKADGTLSDSTKSEVLFSAEDDPIFETFVQHNGITYFPTFEGRVMPFDTSGKVIKPGKAWWLTDATERNWRPGGMNILTLDSSGLAYVLMNPEGGEGSHKDGGAEVWQYDLAKGKRLQRLELKNWGVSLGTTGKGDGRLLMVTNAEMAIDVYRLEDFSFVHTLGVGGATPFFTHGVN